MNKKTLRVLEYEKILNLVSKNVKTNAGKDIALSLNPYNNLYEVKKHLTETREACRLLDTKGEPPFAGICDARDTINRVFKGFSLSAKELIDISNLLRATRKIKEYISSKNGEDNYTELKEIIYPIVELKSIEEEINTAIISPEEISDFASATLRIIRKQLKEKTSSVKDKISSLIKLNSKYLQENLYTIRGDRYVLPVKSEYKNQVKGLVHDQSSSGATFFIEPLSLVNINNEIKELMLKEKAEIERILKALSNMVSSYGEEIKVNGDILWNLDFIFAKARYSNSIDGIFPEINEKGEVRLYKARHPLIEKDKVVSSNIYFGEEFSSLVITGPNTGGKTVTLKTVGLIELMALSGILIPAEIGSKIAVFSKIFADIGDEQSIEQNLSTFSSHMTNIVEIMNSANSNSLVLFDELGAGTDPEEGAALAETILENLKTRGCRIIATTHYSELKAYALRTRDVENASVEFDLNTLRPTFKLLIGIPGKSNAFEISRRLGLSDSVIESSIKLMSSESKNFDDIIADLQDKKMKVIEEEDKVKNIKDEMERTKRKYEEKYSLIQNTRDKAIVNAQREAKEILRQAKIEADGVLKKIREMEKIGYTNESRREMEEQRNILRRKEEKIVIKEKKEKKGKQVKKVSLGEEVYLDRIDKKVTVLSLPNEKGELKVQAGIMTINVKIDDLTIAESKEKVKSVTKREVNINNKRVENKIDLRGLDAEEAIYQTEMFLDAAFVGGINQVTIVHGKGTGVLRQRISEMLRRDKHVKSSRIGEFNEGGTGATIVELK